MQRQKYQDDLKIGKKKKKKRRHDFKRAEDSTKRPKDELGKRK